MKSEKRNKIGKTGKKALIALCACLSLVAGVFGVRKLMLNAGVTVTGFDHFGISEDDQGNLWQYYYNDDSDEVNVALYQWVNRDVTDFETPAASGGLIQSAKCSIIYG